MRKELETSVKCLICSRVFRLRDNYTTRSCSIHTKVSVNGIHPGCGKMQGSTGCVSCMHVSTYGFLDYFYKDPLTAIVELPKNRVDDGTIPCSFELISNPEGSYSISGDNPGEKYYRINVLCQRGYW